jgi:hypothetical protein
VQEGVTWSIEEARAQAEEEARASAPPADYEEGLAWCRMLYARYGGPDGFAELEVADAGFCDDCIRDRDSGFHKRTVTPVDVRYVFGRFTVCHDCAYARLKTRKRCAEILAGETARAPIQHEPPLEPRPDDLQAWALAVSDRYTDQAIRASLRIWHVDTDTIVELVDAAADHRRELEGRKKLLDLQLGTLDTLPDGRCDHCRKHRMPLYLHGDDALCPGCIPAAIAAEPVAA